MAIGGDIIDVTFNHPTFGSGSFAIKSTDDMTFDLGGYRTDDDANAVDSKGKMIKKINRKRWMVEGNIVWEDIDEDTLETLDGIAGDPVDAEFTFTKINNTIYAGTGGIVGDVKAAAQDSTIPTKFSGGGKLAKI